MTPPEVRKLTCAATGASRFAGKSSTASVMYMAGRMWVTMDSALMPGSKTPKPPGCQIQSWLGCQRRTSSFQLIAAERIVVPARKARAASTAGA